MTGNTWSSKIYSMSGKSFKKIVKKNNIIIEWDYKKKIWQVIANQNPADFSQCRASAGPQNRRFGFGSVHSLLYGLNCFARFTRSP